jgi:multidrug transporter EmrE-like cation transporter
MNLFYFFIITLVAIISSIPVIIVKQFVSTNQNQYSFMSILIVLFELTILNILVIISYFYFITKKLSMAVFYPIIKIIEMIIPVIVSVLVYKRKLNTVNYIGLLIAIVAIVCIQW